MESKVLNFETLKLNFGNSQILNHQKVFGKNKPRTSLGREALTFVFVFVYFQIFKFTNQEHGQLGEFREHFPTLAAIS